MNNQMIETTDPKVFFYVSKVVIDEISTIFVGRLLYMRPTLKVLHASISISKSTITEVLIKLDTGLKPNLNDFDIDESSEES